MKSPKPRLIKPDASPSPRFRRAKRVSENVNGTAIAAVISIIPATVPTPNTSKYRHGPGRHANGGQHQQRYRGGSCESVHNSHGKWPHHLIHAEPPEGAIHPAHRRRVLVAWPCRFGIVAMRVAVDVIAMAVRCACG